MWTGTGRGVGVHVDPPKTGEKRRADQPNHTDPGLARRELAAEDEPFVEQRAG